MQNLGGPSRAWEIREAAQDCPRESPPDADGASYHTENSERGKAAAMGQDVTEVRSPHRTLMPHTGGSDHHPPPSLRGRANTARVNKRHRVRDVSRGLKAELLRHCWQDLNTGAARGVDHVTAEAYAKHLHANSAALAQRLQAKRDRTTLVRRGYIPQENGQERPLGLPALEENLLQRAWATLRMAIYAQDCGDCRAGYRPGRGALDAVRGLTVDLQYGKYGYVGEVDVQGFFAHLAYPRLLDMLWVRIEGRAFWQRI